MRLKYNNCAPFKFTQEDQKFIDDNQMYTYRTQDTNLYKNLPSPGRLEFDSKTIYPQKKRYKITDDVVGLISTDKYSFNEKDLFNCQDEMWTRELHKDHL